MSQTDPKLLEALEEEVAVANASGGNRFLRLELDKNTKALIRILPVKMGTKNTWFLRVGQHWVLKRPYMCPIHTSPAAGGDPQARCEICEQVERMLSADSEDATAVKARAWPKWLIFVLTLELCGVNGEWVKCKREELWKPRRKFLSKEAFNELIAIYKRQLGKGRDLTDPVNGYDMLLTKNARGIESISPDTQCALTRQYTGAELDRFMEGLCKVDWSDLQPSGPKKLREGALKLEDLAAAGEVGGEPGGDDRRSRSAIDSDDDGRGGVRNETADRGSSPDRGRGERDSGRGPSRPAPLEDDGRGEPAEAETDVVDADLQPDEPPARPAAPARTESRVAAPRNKLPPPPGRKAAPPPPPRAEPENDARDAGDGEDAGGGEGDDELPDETHDSAPPASRDELPPQEDPAEDMPPPLPASVKPAVRTRPKLSEDMRTRLRDTTR